MKNDKGRIYFGCVAMNDMEIFNSLPKAGRINSDKIIIPIASIDVIDSDTSIKEAIDTIQNNIYDCFKFSGED
jgi:hypothetical protein